MSSTNQNTKATRNSDVVIDFNSEVKGIMSGVNTQDGRELKLAIAIYLAPEKFNIVDMLTAEKVGEKILAALSTNSPAFADKTAKLAALVKEKKEAGLGRKTEIAFEIDAINKAVAGARTMFHRALQSAYWLRSVNATVTDMKASYVKVTWHKAATNTTAAEDRKEQLTRGDLHKRGVDALKTKGVVKARTSKGNGSKPVSVKDKLKEVNTVADGMKVLAETINGYIGAIKDEFVADKATNQLLATMLHKAFAHEGTIDIADVTAFIRENVAGVKISTAQTGRKAA